MAAASGPPIVSGPTSRCHREQETTTWRCLRAETGHPAADHVARARSRPLLGRRTVATTDRAAPDPAREVCRDSSTEALSRGDSQAPGPQPTRRYLGDLGTSSARRLACRAQAALRVIVRAPRSWACAMQGRSSRLVALVADASAIGREINGGRAMPSKGRGAVAHALKEPLCIEEVALGRAP